MYRRAMKEHVITRDSEVMGGAAVFRGAREQVIFFLESAKDRLVESVS
jgi:uncharacterized protein (DUF433 family)